MTSGASTQSAPRTNGNAVQVSFQSYLAFSFNDNDRHSSGRPAVFGWKGLVTIPKNYDLKRMGIVRRPGWLAFMEGSNPKAFLKKEQVEPKPGRHQN